MEDPRIISALFIFLKMAYYNVLINSIAPLQGAFQVTLRYFRLPCVHLESILSEDRTLSISKYFSRKYQA